MVRVAEAAGPHKQSRHGLLARPWSLPPPESGIRKTRLTQLGTATIA